jgi:hypothetical protein
MSLKLKEQETRQCAKGGEICRAVGALGVEGGRGGPCLSPQILTDHLILYLNQGKVILLRGEATETG